VAVADTRLKKQGVIMPSPKKISISTLTGNALARNILEDNAAAEIAKPVSAIAVIVISAYIAAQMLADIASLKIGLIFNLAVDMGTFIYPITFTLRDLVHKQLGKKNARRQKIDRSCSPFFIAEPAKENTPLNIIQSSDGLRFCYNTHVYGYDEKKNKLISSNSRVQWEPSCNSKT
jgi:hypothetical protein